MVWGIYEINSIINKDNIYLIDFGESDYVGRLFFGKKEKNFWRKGTNTFKSINAHLSKRPSPNDDIESLVYSLLYRSKLGLPWEKIVTPPAHLNKKVLEMKKNFNYYKWCGEEYEFLGDILEYLKIIHEEKKEMNYHVLKKLMGKQEMEIKVWIYWRNKKRSL